MRPLFLLLALLAVPAEAQTIDRYALIATVPGTTTDPNGNTVAEPAGYVIDVIAWDGVTPYGGEPWATAPACVAGNTCEIRTAGSLVAGQVTTP